METLATKEQYEASAELLIGISNVTGINLETVMYSFADYMLSVSNYAKFHCVSFDEAGKHFEESGRFDAFLADSQNIYLGDGRIRRPFVGFENIL